MKRGDFISSSLKLVGISSSPLHHECDHICESCCDRPNNPSSFLSWSVWPKLRPNIEGSLLSGSHSTRRLSCPICVSEGQVITRNKHDLSPESTTAPLVGFIFVGQLQLQGEEGKELATEAGGLPTTVLLNR